MLTIVVVHYDEKTLCCTSVVPTIELNAKVQ